MSQKNVFATPNHDGRFFLRFFMILFQDVGANRIFKPRKPVRRLTAPRWIFKPRGIGCTVLIKIFIRAWMPRVEVYYFCQTHNTLLESDFSESFNTSRNMRATQSVSRTQKMEEYQMSHELSGLHLPRESAICVITQKVKTVYLSGCSLV